MQGLTDHRTGGGDAAGPAGLFVVDPSRDMHNPRPLSQDAPRRRVLIAGFSMRIRSSRPLRVRQARYGQDANCRHHVLAAMIRGLSLPPKAPHPARDIRRSAQRVAAGLGTVHHFMGGRYLDASPRTTQWQRESWPRTPIGLAEDRGDVPTDMNDGNCSMRALEASASCDTRAPRGHWVSVNW